MTHIPASTLTLEKVLNLFVIMKLTAKFIPSFTLVYDTNIKIYRHMDFFGHEYYLHAKVPRIQRDDGRVRLIMPLAAARKWNKFLLENCPLDGEAYTDTQPTRELIS